MSARGLIIIPAYDEADTIGAVLQGLRTTAPHLDRVVVNDGSRDATGQIVTHLGERLLSLPCNLGYGRALQTGIKYALMRGYDFVVFFDADGQHNPDNVVPLVNALLEGDVDMVIGSRFTNDRAYTGSFGRRMGQRLFSYLSLVLLGRRIYDTTSGLKAVRASACQALVRGTFLDFHTEAIVRLGMLGFSIAEMPVSVRERQHGQSMYSLRSAIEYPIKTFLLTLVAAVDALLQRRIQ
jgi:glycosyltransferase involved in cell wall biosynthesis